MNIFGTSNNDTLNGTTSADVLFGQEGNDFMRGNSGEDWLSGGAGTDTLLGDDGNDTLDGGAGIDTMAGGMGDDVYYVDTLWDSVNEFGVAGAGIDTVITSVSGYTLSANVENLIMQGTTGQGAGGNELNNTITGSFGLDIVDGFAGNDSINGGQGNDLLFGGVGDDALDGGDGNDVLDGDFNSGLFGSTAPGGVEGNDFFRGGNGNDMLYGRGGSDTMLGDDGNDTLDGGTGGDVMAGGLGDDTFLVDSIGDSVSEWGVAGGGTDTVITSLTGYQLGANIENLVMQSTTGQGAAGNALANTITGSTGLDIVDGMAGNDTISGGLGNDLLFGGEGSDALDGGDGNDVLSGNNNSGLFGATTLSGAAGNDTYRGGKGNDTLTASATTSNDVFGWGRGDGADSLTDAGGVDRLDVSAGVTASQMWLRHVGNNLELSVIGTTDTFTINGWYSSSANQVESIKLADGKTLTANHVEALVSSMAAFSAPAAGQTTLPASYQTALNPVIAANWS